MSWQEIYKIVTDDMTPGLKRALLSWTLVLLFSFHVAWACGWIPNVPGFALASDTKTILQVQKDMEEDWDKKLGELKASVDALQDSVHEMRVDMLEERILMLRSARCDAEEYRNREQYSRRLQRALRQYQMLTQTSYPLEPCQ